MVTTSGLPEHASNSCPFCDVVIKLEPSLQLGDSFCPACGQPIWFVTSDGASIIIEPIRKMTFEGWIAQHLSLQLGLSEEEVAKHINKATTSRYN